MILNDIELVAYLRGLNLFKDREFFISHLFLADYYLNHTEKQIILELEREEKIELFEVNFEFLKIKDKYSLSIPEASNLYYAKQKGLPIITNQKGIILICKEINVRVYEPCEALRLLNIGDEKVKFIQKILNSENRIIDM